MQPVYKGQFDPKVLVESPKTLLSLEKGPAQGLVNGSAGVRRRLVGEGKLF